MVLERRKVAREALSRSGALKCAEHCVLRPQGSSARPAPLLHGPSWAQMRNGLKLRLAEKRRPAQPRKRLSGVVG